MRKKIKIDMIELLPIAKNCVVFIVLLIGVYILEKDHLLRSSIFDDLQMKSGYNINFFEAICMHGYKFRPVSNVVIWIVTKICNGNLYLWGYINIFMAAFSAFVILKLVKHNSKSFFGAIVASVLYIVSRFSYYQITTQIGVMESTATIFAILFIWYLFQYMDKLRSKDYYIALFFYALCSLSHERYVVLMPVMLYAWFVSEKKGNILKKENLPHYKKPFFTITVFAVIMILFKFLVNIIMMGTGGAVVTETATIMSVINNFFMSIGYILSVGFKDLYLSMIVWPEYSIEMKIIVIISILMIFAIIAVSIYEAIKMEKADRKKMLSIMGMFIMSIGAMIFISSVTIRVELRWMYVPYMMMVFLLVYLTFLRTDKFFSLLKKICLGLYLISMLIFNIYCRNGYYGRLYYWWGYCMANDLTDETYGVYGDEMYLKSWVIIISNGWDKVVSFDDILKTFDVNDQYELHLEVIESINELSNINEIQNKEVLYYDVEKSDFINISNVIRDYYAPPLT